MPELPSVLHLPGILTNNAIFKKKKKAFFVSDIHRFLYNFKWWNLFKQAWNKQFIHLDLFCWERRVTLLLLMGEYIYSTGLCSKHSCPWPPCTSCYLKNLIINFSFLVYYLFYCYESFEELYNLFSFHCIKPFPADFS